tara:strand:- start:414 stop:794 length:381 start_codon:yes stop_codon:yes gene_type:complete
MTDVNPSRVVTDYQMAKLALVIDRFRKLDNELPCQTLATFLYIASHDDCTKVDLERALEFSTASGSRNTDWLSGKHRILDRQGLGLIVKSRDPTNKRRLLLQLTPKGKRLVQTIKDILYGEATNMG